MFSTTMNIKQIFQKIALATMLCLVCCVSTLNVHAQESPPASSSSASPGQTQSAAPQREFAETPELKQPPRVWLVVEVLERVSSAGKSSLAFNDAMTVVILDSATQSPIYARSGELVEVGKARTYYVSIVPPANKPYTVEKDGVQVLRTPRTLADDIVFQRDFTVTPATDALSPNAYSYSVSEPLYKPAPLVRSDANTIEQELAAMRRELSQLRRELSEAKQEKLDGKKKRKISSPKTSKKSTSSATPRDIAAMEREIESVRRDINIAKSSNQQTPQSSSLQPRTMLDTPLPSDLASAMRSCVYVIQFCAVPIEREAQRIAEALASDNVRDARVEYFEDATRGLKMFRVRGGCFISSSDARTSIADYKRAADHLHLGVTPIVVRNP